jgi:hypothetical protein
MSESTGPSVTCAPDGPYLVAGVPFAWRARCQARFRAAVTRQASE